MVCVFSRCVSFSYCYALSYEMDIFFCRGLKLILKIQSAAHSQKAFALRLRTSFSEKRFSTNWLQRWLLILMCHIIFLFHTCILFPFVSVQSLCIPILLSLIFFFCYLTWNYLQILWTKSKFFSQLFNVKSEQHILRQTYLHITNLLICVKN